MVVRVVDQTLVSSAAYQSRASVILGSALIRRLLRVGPFASDRLFITYFRQSVNRNQEENIGIPQIDGKALFPAGFRCVFFPANLVSGNEQRASRPGMDQPGKSIGLVLREYPDAANLLADAIGSGNTGDRIR